MGLKTSFDVKRTLLNYDKMVTKKLTQLNVKVSFCNKVNDCVAIVKALK